MTKIPPAEVHRIIGEHMQVGAQNLVLDLERSRGSRLYDSLGRREFLDMTSFFATSALGMNHPGLDTPEFIREIGRVALHKVTNPAFFTVEMAEAVRTFSEFGMPEYLPHLFFVEGGALAVENALKAAFDWKYRKNQEAGRESSADELAVVHFRKAFHGRSGYTLSLTNTADPRKYMHFPRFDWVRVDPPELRFPLTEEVLVEVKAAEQRTLREIRGALAARPHRVAALIVEPVMGEGGDVHFRPEFFAALRALCDEQEIFFILDEVQTGMGLTGSFWAHEHFDVRPDAIAFGKKAQVCGMLVGRRIDEVERNVFVEPSRINSTWGGNLTDMVRFRRILEIMRRDNLLENARIQGRRLLAGLEELARGDGELGNARGLGLMCAVDVPRERRARIIERCFAEGMIILPCGTCSIRFRPQLACSAEDIDSALDIFRRSL